MTPDEPTDLWSELLPHIICDMGISSLRDTWLWQINPPGLRVVKYTWSRSKGVQLQVTRVIFIALSCLKTASCKKLLWYKFSSASVEVLLVTMEMRVKPCCIEVEITRCANRCSHPQITELHKHPPPTHTHDLTAPSTSPLQLDC